MGVYRGLLLACLLALPAFAADVGKPAPGFELTDTKGKTHRLSDYKGKTVVLEWVNHDCPYVKKHYNSGHMQKLQKEWTGKKVVWLSVNSSAAGKQGNFSKEEWKNLTEEKQAAPTAVLLDADGKVGRLYGAKTTPHMYVINSKGLLVYNGAIDSIESTETADVAKAEDFVQRALAEVTKGKAVTVANTKPYGCAVKY